MIPKIILKTFSAIVIVIVTAKITRKRRRLEPWVARQKIEDEKKKIHSIVMYIFVIYANSYNNIVRR